MIEEKNLSFKKNLQFNWLVVLLLLPAIFLISYWKEFNGLYGTESHENFRLMQGLFTFLSGGTFLQPFHFNPILYPLSGAIVSLVVPKLFALQFVSLAASGVCYISFCKLLNQLYPGGTQRQRYAFLILFLSPFYIKASLIALPDMLSMAFTMLALLECYKWKETKSSQSLLISICTAVLAVQTRYATFFLLLPVFLMVWNTAKNRFSILLICIFAIIMTFTPSFFFKGEDSLQLLSHPWLKEWSPLNLFKSSFNQSGSVVNFHLPNIVFVLSTLLHPGFCLIGILFIILSFRIPFKLPTGWVYGHLLFLIFIAGLPSQNTRYLLPAFPIVLLTFYPAYELIIFKLKSRNQRVGIYLIAVAIQLLLSYKVMSPVILHQQEEYIIANSLRKMPVVTLNTYGIDVALRSYEIPQEISNMWNSPDALFMDNDLLLFNASRFENSGEDSIPFRNFVNLRNQNRLILITSYPGGWELFRIRQSN